MLRHRAAIGLAFLVFSASCRTSQTAVNAVDGEISRHIDAIKAIDNHSHVPGMDRKNDKGYDELRCDALPVTPAGLMPFGLRLSPAQQAAVRTLYGVDLADASDASISKLQSVAASVREKNGAAHYAWVLDKAGIATVLANRIAMVPELTAPQFAWVSYVDALMFPLDNSDLKKVNPDRNALFAMVEELERLYLGDARMTSVPATLDEYLQNVVLATLRKQKAAGAVAVKFEAAYLRSVAFEEVDRGDATSIYAKYVKSGAPPGPDYKALQDYLFKQIALEAGRLSMPVHIHTGNGCGESFDDSGASAMLLSPMLNDPQLRGTRFVLLHGNRPREREMATLIMKPNVYADVSVLEFFLSTRELAQVLRPMLESLPEHVIFGTDAGPFGPGLDWEETTVMGAQQFRKALALALSQMLSDGVVTRAQAMQIADGVLRGNAAELYHLK